MMEVDDDEVSINKKVKKCDFLSDEDDDDEDVEFECDVVVCSEVPQTEMYCVAYPTRKKNEWDANRHLRARYKKNVRLLEMRFDSDTNTGSFDKKKAEFMASNSASPAKDSGSFKPTEDVYEGRAFQNENPLCNAIGYFQKNKFYLHPVAGTFEMHRSITGLNKKKGGGKDDDGMSTEDEEAEEGSSAGGAGGQVRVKFSRPETERQKKRREASALHREKKIASDVWIDMDVHLSETSVIDKKLTEISVESGVGVASNDDRLTENERLEIRQLVDKAIICGCKEELVIESGKEHMLSKQRIQELPLELQVKAHMVKAHVIKTNEMIELIGEDKMSVENVLGMLRQCARLVGGVWVLQSDLLFHNLPPAHSNVAGRTDVYRSELWRNARDLALCLVDAGHRVTRETLITCFRLNAKDAEEVLSTFGVRDDSRSWRLRVEDDLLFLNDPKTQQLVLEEKKAWLERWDELQKIMNKANGKKK